MTEGVGGGGIGAFSLCFLPIGASAGANEEEAFALPFGRGFALFFGPLGATSGGSGGGDASF